MSKYSPCNCFSSHPTTYCPPIFQLILYMAVNSSITIVFDIYSSYNCFFSSYTGFSSHSTTHPPTYQSYKHRVYYPLRTMRLCMYVIVMKCWYQNLVFSYIKFKQLKALLINVKTASIMNQYKNRSHETCSTSLVSKSYLLFSGGTSYNESILLEML